VCRHNTNTKAIIGESFSIILGSQKIRQINPEEKQLKSAVKAIILGAVNFWFDGRANISKYLKNCSLGSIFFNRLSNKAG
jgi:hypothetical protein